MAVRITQEAIEVLVRPQLPHVRVSQVAVEVIATGAAPKARVSQVAVEVLVASNINNLGQALPFFQY